VAAENGTQNERLEIQNVLKAMNWEVRLEEARARRKEVLDGREQAETTPKPPKARLPGLRFPSGDFDRAADGDTPVPRSENVIPLLKPVFPSPGVSTDDAPVTVASPAPVTDPVVAPSASKNASGRLALGFGIGLGLGLSIVFAAFLLGPRFAPGVADAPVRVAAPSPSPIVAAPEVVQDAAKPTPQEAGISDQPVVTAIVTADQAPRIDGSDPVALSGITGFASPIAVPSAMIQPAIPDRKVALMPAPLTGDVALAQAGQVQRPEIVLLPSALSRDVAVDQSLSQRVTIPDLSAGRVKEVVRTSLPAPLPADTPAAPIAIPDGLGIPATSVAPLSQPVVAPGDTTIVSSVAVSDGLTITPPAQIVEPSFDVAALTMTGPAPFKDSLRLPNAENFTLHVSAPVTVSDKTVETVLASLRPTGIELSRVNSVPFKVSATQVRYFHAADAKQAKAIASRIGADTRDFTSFRPSPPDGWIEVYLAGDGAPAAPKKVHRARPKSEAERLHDSLVQSLRRRDYL